MADQYKHREKSCILYHILDRFIGSREMVAVKRKLTFVNEQIEITCSSKYNLKRFYAGSSAEGIIMAGSDRDLMLIDNHVIVTCPDQCIDTPLDRTKTVFMMRDADCRPGYVNLELINQGHIFNTLLAQSLVPNGDVLFISSEMCSRAIVDALGAAINTTFEQHGPACNLSNKQSNGHGDIDCVFSLPCNSWPQEANEWVSRPRLHEWPGLDLRDQIVKGGCHLVPVGDKKTSPDTFLQWRISFVCAERELVHSLTHVQFLVYGLFKYFLKQISDRFEQSIRDADIISSYIIKTIIFHAVESTPHSLWQERNMFYCFMLCFNILIVWVNARHCPNYFIKSNNLFLGKVHGENQQNLIRILTELHDMQWKCLSVGTFIQPSIGARINRVRNGEWEYVLPAPALLERESDTDILCWSGTYASDSFSLPVALTLLSKSKSDIDEFIAYICTAYAMSHKAKAAFETHVCARGNKEKYKYLRKCKELLARISSLCPGLLSLATYYYQTGNYTKALDMCRNMISSFKMYLGHGSTFKDKDRYEHLYCGRGYTLLHKYREVCSFQVNFQESALSFCPPQLHEQMTKSQGAFLSIPPLPYAVFLSFLCYHDLGDTRRRDTALIHLRALKYDDEQGGSHHWIVHNLLGICYEMVGDTRRALREYRDSLGGQRILSNLNPAEDSIERLKHSQ